MADAPYVEYGSDLVIIREIFDGAHELFENELEHALDIGCQNIVIEPCRLGEETARWILVGDCLSKASVLTGLGSVASGVLWPDRPMVQFSLLATSLLSNTVHTCSWQSDLCASYRVERNPEVWTKLVGSSRQPFADNVSLVTSTEYLNTMASGPSGDGNGTTRPDTPSPVVLCRKTDRDIRRSNLLKAAVSLLALAFSVFRLFKTSLYDLLTGGGGGGSNAYGALGRPSLSKLAMF